ncbi:MAG TPA: adenosylcobinamide-GDP ribazoletransferase [Nitrososphaeraceae archaeon]|nr:adenosylcobinamide-GDP ribazoletransferase [Nitrososphaeraceae archaeon]
MFSPIISLFSFLTIIPTSKTSLFDLNIIAKNMHYFPLCGGIIGLIVGLISLFSNTFLPQYFSSFIVLVTFVIVTGVHHIDALADFADGIMKKGDRESKRKAMSDPYVGSAGTTALIINFIGIYIALFNFESPIKLFYAIIVAEIISKYIMVMQASIGTSAWSGLSSPFTIEMKKRTKVIISIIITVVLIFIIEGIMGLLTLGIVVIIGLIIYIISYKNFGGVSGDVFGASNEISRLSALLILSTFTM